MSLCYIIGWRILIRMGHKIFIYLLNICNWKLFFIIFFITISQYAMDFQILKEYIALLSDPFQLIEP